MSILRTSGPTVVSEKGEEARATAVDVAEVVLAIIPWAGGPIVAAIDAVQERRTRRAVTLMQKALEDYGMRIESLEAIAQDEEQAEVLTHAVQVAMDARTEEKLDALARILADCTVGRDRPKMERAHLLLSLLAGLEAPHIEVLAVIGTRHPGQGPLQGQVVLGLNRQGLVLHRPDLADILDPILAALQALGLVANLGSTGSGGQIGPTEIYQVTDLGSWFLATIETHGDS
jgi:hypothetical protein